MKRTKEEIQKDIDEALGHRAGIKSGDLIVTTDPAEPVTKKGMSKQVDVLKEALDHYYMVDAWVWRGLTSEGKKTTLPHHRE